MIKIGSSEITPQHLYASRRNFITGAGAALAGLFLLGGAGCGPKGSGQPTGAPATPGTDFCATAQAGQNTDELGDALTTCEDVISYNNFYEFSLSKDDVARHTGKFRPEPWTVSVGGLVKNPKTYSIDDLRAFDTEERIYRMRCVEAWSMVIPWMGFPLARLLKDVEPTSQARYVRFESLFDPDQMPGQDSVLAQFDWPYVEGLALDEAYNDLVLLSTGIYGNRILPQNGAPIRLVVPWKYGFKGIKSIVKIDLVEEMPVSLWMGASPREYGFYANVNPDVNHPRWSQSSERRIGEGGRRPTLLFNGYEEEVAHLYKGMDLAKFY